MIEVLMQNLKSMCKHEKCFENTNQAKRLVGEVVDDIVIGARDLGFDFQSSQTPCCHFAAYFGMVALKISALFFSDVIGWISCASMLRVMKFFVYSVIPSLYPVSNYTVKNYTLKKPSSLKVKYKLRVESNPVSMSSSPAT